MAFGFDDIIGAIAGPLIGGIFGSEAANTAADAQVASGNASNATQLAMYEQNRADMAPWRTAGVNALNTLTGRMPDLNRRFSMADFQQDPGYGFRLSEGIKGIDRSAAARGLLQSGGTLKGVNRFAQDYASNEYGNAYNRYNQDNSTEFNRLAALSGIGQTATQQVGNYGMSTAQNVGATQVGMGNARASGYVGGANAINSAVGQGFNNYYANQLLNRLPYDPYGGGTNWSTYYNDMP